MTVVVLPLLLVLLPPAASLVLASTLWIHARNVVNKGVELGSLVADQAISCGGAAVQLAVLGARTLVTVLGARTLVTSIDDTPLLNLLLHRTTGTLARQPLPHGYTTAAPGSWVSAARATDQWHYQVASTTSSTVVSYEEPDYQAR